MLRFRAVSLTMAIIAPLINGPLRIAPLRTGMISIVPTGFGGAKGTPVAEVEA